MKINAIFRTIYLSASTCFCQDKVGAFTATRQNIPAPIAEGEVGEGAPERLSIAPQPLSAEVVGISAGDKHYITSFALSQRQSNYNFYSPSLSASSRIFPSGVRRKNAIASFPRCTESQTANLC